MGRCLATSGHEAGQARPGHLGVGSLEALLDGRDGGDAEDHDDEDVGHQSHEDAVAGEVGGVYLLSLHGLGLDGRVHRDADALGGLAATLRLPGLEEEQREGDGDDCGEDLGQVIDRGATDDDLSDAEDDADEQAKGPALTHTLAAVHDGQHEEGDDEAENRADTGGHRGNHRDVQAAGLGSHEHRQTDGTEGHRDGVGDQGGDGTAKLAKANGDQHGSRDGDRGAESSKGLEQTAEAEGDEDAEDARIVTDEEEGAAQVVETTGDDRHLVHPDGAQQNPRDREQTVEESLSTRGDCHTDRHVECGDCHDEGDAPREEASQMRLPAQRTKSDEHGQHRQHGKEGREPLRPQRVGRWGEGLEKNHRRTPLFNHCLRSANRRQGRADLVRPIVR